MNDVSPTILMLLLALLGGGILGAVFFGGLWWTVHKGLQSSRAGTWFVTSAVLRFALVLSGFYLITYGQWPRLIACLSGFIVARFLVIWLSPRHVVAKEPNDAP